MAEEPNKFSIEDAAQKFISLAEAAEISGLSPDHLRRFVREGRIWGIKISRNWMTTEKAIRDYLATDPKPGPKPKTD